MNKPRRNRYVAYAFLAAIALSSPGIFPANSDQLKQEENTWRAKRSERLLKPDGWFSLVGLNWLRPGKTTVGTTKDNTIQLTGNAAAHVGVFDLEGEQVQLLAPAGGFPAGLTVNGKAATAGVIREDTPLQIGTFTLVAIQRGDRFALRIKDAQAQTRLQFHGLKWFAPEEKYKGGGEVVAVHAGT